MPKIIAVCNQKGGVGKTTTALNVATSIALSGTRVLLVDLDPQANATGGLGVDKKQLRRSTYDVLLGNLSLDQVVVVTQIQNLSLAPSSVELSGAEVELVSLPDRATKLKAATSSLQAYDLILIDCPPSLGLLTINALTAAHSVLIPMQCEYYAMEGLSQLLDSVKLVQGSLNPGLEVEGILLTMADFRTKLTNDVIQEVRRFFGSKVYETVIPRSVRLSEAPSHGLPIALYDPNSTGAHAYQQLALKLKENLHAGDTRIGQRDSSSYSGGSSGERSDADSAGSDQAGQIPASPESRSV